MQQSVVKSNEYTEKVYIQLQHSKQRYNWDCGISCVLMALSKSDRETLLKNLLTVCKEEGFNKSTWTIDLCYLLRRYSIAHKFYTITLGVHPGYRSNPFYSHILPKDEDRIRSRFEEAKKNGINIYNETISILDVLKHLTKGPAILLTNAQLLTCDICKVNKLSIELRQCLPWPASYQGHYVILCGFNLTRQKVYYRNPALNNRVCVMSIEAMDDARKCYGTDEDLILIYR